MKRGEVWWSLQSPPPAQDDGPRLVLLLSWDAGLTRRDRVIVATITTNIRGLDAEVFLDQEDGLYSPCVVNLDIMSTIFRSWLTRRVSELSIMRMQAVEIAMHRALGITLPCPHGQLAFG